MSAIGNINVMVGANTSDLTKKLGGAEKEVGGFGSSIAGLATKGAALAGGFFGVGKAIELAMGGISGAADMEQAEISFGVLFKSTDTAKAVLGDLSKFAAETPFELPQLTEAARSLAAFGFEAGSITPNLRMLGDIASGVNTPIGELSELYGKARVQGRLFAEDINQLTGRGIPITQALAKQFGVTDDKVKKLVESGKIGFPEIEKAFQSMTGAGGQFNGMMAAQSQSLSGLWSTLQDGIGGTLRDLSAYLIDAFNVKEGIASLTSGIESAKGSLSTIQPFFEQILNIGGTIFSTIGEGFGYISEGASATFGYLGSSLGTTIDGMLDVVLDLAIGFEWAFANIGNIAALGWENLKLGAVSWYEDIAHFLTVALPATFTWMTENWSDIWSTMLDYTLTVLANLGTNIRSAMKEIWDFISSAGTNAMEFSWTPLTEGAFNAIKKLPDIPERAMTDLEKALTESVNSMGTHLGESLADHIQKQRDELLGPGGSIGDKTPAAAIAALPTPSTPATKTANASEAPKLAGAFVKGSIEEASLRNKIEAGPEFAKMIEQNRVLIDEAKKQTRAMEKIAAVKPIPVGAS